MLHVLGQSFRGCRGGSAQLCFLWEEFGRRTETLESAHLCPAGYSCPQDALGVGRVGTHVRRRARDLRMPRSFKGSPEQPESATQTRGAGRAYSALSGFHTELGQSLCVS